MGAFFSFIPPCWQAPRFLGRNGGPRLALAVTAMLVSPAGGAAVAQPLGSHGAAYRVLDQAAHWIATGFEVAGVTTILLVACAATIRFTRRAAVAPDWVTTLPAYRADLGRGVLLGLEMLVAADIIGTVAVTPSFGNLGVLAIVVLIRTFLSISLGVEIEGHWPWRRRDLERAAEGRPRE